MRPAARLQAAIELTAEIEAEAFAAGLSLEDTVRRFLRQRRYAGGGDRRTVTGLAYDAMRHRGEDLWRLSGRDSMACRLALRLALAGENWQDFFSGGEPHGPSPLSPEDIAAIGEGAEADIGEAPLAARYNFPDFLTAPIEARFGASVDAEMAALAQRPGLDLRANGLKSNVDEVRKAIEKEGIISKQTPFSPWGLRLPAGTAIQSLASFTRGLIEVQDEGSQLAALVTDARPGQQVVDLCAGAGGKTLALAAMMENRGQIHAFDSDARRLKPLAGRVQRAGVRNVQAHARDDEGEARLTTLKGRCDIVLVDAPCSGSGTWRRDPSLPWRLTAERLGALVGTQGKLLAEAATLLRPGGRIVYVTCSLLPQENEAVIARFLERNKAFEIIPYEEFLKEKVRSDLPPSYSSDTRFLQLGPARHGTDGFFVAALRLRD